MCGGYTIELSINVTEDERVFIEFIFCCYTFITITIAKYPLEDVCENLDYYIDKCENFIIEKQICKRCQETKYFGLYDGFDIKDKTNFTIINGCLLKCTQGCTFCARHSHRFIDSKYKYVSDKIYEAISKSKKIYNIQTSNTGEPFEDKYLVNNFLFNLHNSNIKRVEILTNAVHIKDISYLKQLKEYLDKYKIDVRFNINFSGFTKELYEAYCTSKFERAVRNIKYIYEVFGKEKILITYIISKHNQHLSYNEVSKQIKETFPFLELENVNRVLDAGMFYKTKEFFIENNNKHVLGIE